VVTLHLILSDRSRGIVGAEDLARMKRSAYIVNTSRGPLVDQPALIAALQEGRIAAPASTSSIPSRCRSTIRCSPHPTPC
jgi:phosphoglycerate dehydrogenase-like enzyme